MKKINMKPKKRLDNIKKIARYGQTLSIFKFREIKQILEKIEFQADTPLLSKLNGAMKNIDEGNYLTEKEFANSVRGEKDGK